ncbi:MAG TPA: VOC family protein [Stellaceae bacterium]|nr:VOC family protein [Stellaceae bacterium]
MLDHVMIGVTDLVRSKAFYDQALKPLGIERFASDSSDFAGYGTDKKGFLWVARGDAVPVGVHIAFAAPNRSIVDAFHAAAIAAGGRDHGAPGLRPQYHPAYYGAFVLDPDGHNIEAVCHAPVEGA